MTVEGRMVEEAKAKAIRILERYGFTTKDAKELVEALTILR